MVVIEPYGWYPPQGADPSATKTVGSGKGALSVKLWKTGEAPPRDGWD